ncbi:hypothetical protein [Blastococcus sp. SYSU D00813]
MTRLGALVATAGLLGAAGACAAVAAVCVLFGRCAAEGCCEA